MLDELHSEGCNRISTSPQFDLALRTIGLREKACFGFDMAMKAVGTSLYQAWSFAGPGSLDRAGGYIPHRQHIVAVDFLGLPTESMSTIDDLASCDIFGTRELRKAVVLTDENEWKPPQCCNVERLGEHTLVGRSIAEKRDRDRTVALNLGGERGTGRKTYAARHDSVGTQDALGNIGHVHGAAFPPAYAGTSAINLLEKRIGSAVLG